MCCVFSSFQVRLLRLWQTFLTDASSPAKTAFLCFLEAICGYSVEHLNQAIGNSSFSRGFGVASLESAATAPKIELSQFTVLPGLRHTAGIPEHPEQYKIPLNLTARGRLPSNWSFVVFYVLLTLR